ncbi:MAG TPA: outer membrane beta-barrel protein [Xanthobacteraceae bacterium]|nr:outer membrane beta-barrel protein [Xanthobacteraceae bacterium]
MPRRCRPSSITGLVLLRLAVAAPGVLIALAPAPSGAQTPAPQSDTDLLQPSLEGNPDNPPRFAPSGHSATLAADQAPPAGKFTAPVYGNPAGFGAGDTGFDSSNARKRKRLPSVPPTLPAPPAPEVHPAKAAARPGATLPPPPGPWPISNPPPEVHPPAAASRPGAVLPIPPPEDFQGSASTPPPGMPPPNTLPLGTVPRGTLPIAAGDPYAALGVTAGSFLILPAVELSGGYNTNPTHSSPTGPASAYYVAAPELHVRSLWSSSSLTADIAGSYSYYQNDVFVPPLNFPYVNAKVDGTFDVSRYTKILLESRVNVATDNPGSPNITANLAQLPIDTTLGGTLGLAQQLGRFDVSLKGTFDRSMYTDAELTNGQIGNFDWRAFDQYGGILRLGYDIDPGLMPFVEVGEDTRVHDSPVDVNGENRNSNGSSAKIGATVNLLGALTGEMAAGYMQREYVAPLPAIGGVTLDGSLLWQASALTTAKFTAASGVGESVVAGVSGSFSRDFNVEVDHALRTWLIAMAKVGYGHDEYVGLDRADNRYFAAAGLIYKMNRDIQFKATVRQDWLTSNVSGVANNATSFLLTMRLQR